VSSDGLEREVRLQFIEGGEGEREAPGEEMVVGVMAFMERGIKGRKTAPLNSNNAGRNNGRDGFGPWRGWLLVGVLARRSAGARSGPGGVARAVRGWARSARWCERLVGRRVVAACACSSEQANGLAVRAVRKCGWRWLIRRNDHD
jgi:hypothetical protein